MFRTLIASILILLAVTACSDPGTALQVPPSSAFNPTPYEVTPGATPGGLATPTNTPAPTGTPTSGPAPTNTPTSAPNAPTPTDTPTNTPTVTPNTVVVKVGDSGISPSTVSLKNGQYVKLFLQNTGSGEFECQVQNLQPDTVVDDESLAGPVSSDQLGTADSDASNGKIHLFAMTQGAAGANFTPTKPGSYPLNCTINGRQVNGTITVQ